MLRTVPHSSRGGGLYVLLADQITIGLLMARGLVENPASGQQMFLRPSFIIRQ